MTIPVPFPTSYSTLKAIAVKGESLGDNCICPKCRTKGLLDFTGSWVERGIIWFNKFGHIAFETIKIPLARCRNCRGRFRVLPAEILPFKIFCLLLIEKYIRIYLASDGPSLQKAVEGEPGDYPRPHHTSLHRWLTFMGEMVLGRLGLSPQAFSVSTPRSASPTIPWLPTSALIAETAKRLRIGIKRIWTRPVKIPAWKYRSPRRREQLQACARLLATAVRLFPDDPHPLTAWEGKIIEYLNVPGWWFSSRYACTDIINDFDQPEEIRCLRTSKKRKKEANNGSRAPPDGVFSV